MKAEPTTTCVYFIKEDPFRGRIKIGQTEKPIIDHVAELQIGSSDMLEIHRVIYSNDHITLENRLHQYFTNKRMRIGNGWFYLKLQEVDNFEINHLLINEDLLKSTANPFDYMHDVIMKSATLCKNMEQDTREHQLRIIYEFSPNTVLTDEMIKIYDKEIVLGWFNHRKELLLIQNGASMFEELARKNGTEYVRTTLQQHNYCSGVMSILGMKFQSKSVTSRWVFHSLIAMDYDRLYRKSVEYGPCKLFNIPYEKFPEKANILGIQSYINNVLYKYYGISIIYNEKKSEYRLFDKFAKLFDENFKPIS